MEIHPLVRNIIKRISLMRNEMRSILKIQAKFLNHLDCRSQFLLKGCRKTKDTLFYFLLKCRLILNVLITKSRWNISSVRLIGVDQGKPAMRFRRIWNITGEIFLRSLRTNSLTSYIDRINRSLSN